MEQPIYRRIADALESDIASGGLRAGDKVPSERALAQKLNVSRMTVRQALRHLGDRGLLETRTGQGTFVGSARIRQRLSTLTGFTEEMAWQGRQTSSLILYSETTAPDTDCRKALQLSRDERVHRLIRVRLVEDAPVAHECTEIPAAFAPSLLDLADYARHSLYGVLREQFGIRPTTAEQTLAAGSADAAVASHLQLGSGSSVLKLTRLTFDREATPFEYVRSVYRGDTFVMNVHLTL